MNDPRPFLAPSRHTPETHQRNADKLSRIPVRVEQPETLLRKPAWIRVKAGDNAATLHVKRVLRAQGLHSVCEEAACPNLGECFSRGTATFMIMGDLCTRRCPFCDVAHGKPQALDAQEPEQLATAITELKLRYVVITSVNRDDLRDGGSAHFAACIAAIRRTSPTTRIEILVPDFRGRIPLALETLATNLPDVFNHNLETVPRLYPQARPGADYATSLGLLEQFHLAHPGIPTKSGLMLGLGETLEEVRATLQDLRQHHCAMLTLGQYLQPSRDHLPVSRYVTPDEFTELAEYAREIGFGNVASAPLVRSSYHADEQVKGL
ncbi:lipoyl synthase [Candidatus Methylospira mobilis]|uniref:Lipoyl synthase n=1 Tax=Candidatus Methylospira mobilis TaxID=1808979 RepID=A0A5Q0BL36_9GAMM|nr:lipoyl synthase [Candidatus Methylospira mobilis]QFY44553.1 lipoyl synthase [Candidatus Methylospira mobilis]WNV06013.1 lipoyl synthase [Candidatus Methylospira mobilis]